MFTIIIIATALWLIGIIISNITNITYKDTAFYGAIALAALMAFGASIVYIIIYNNNPTKTSVTPSKYANQTYYIDSNNKLYIQNTDTTKPFGGDISDKIEYRNSAKTPSIQFKTIKSIGDADTWIPFKYKTETKTSITKVILPKSALTQKLTKVDVVNPIQDSTDLTLTQ